MKNLTYLMYYFQKHDKNFFKVELLVETIKLKYNMLSKINNVFQTVTLLQTIAWFRFKLRFTFWYY